MGQRVIGSQGSTVTLLLLQQGKSSYRGEGSCTVLGTEHLAKKRRGGSMPRGRRALAERSKMRQHSRFLEVRKAWPQVAVPLSTYEQSHSHMQPSFQTPTAQGVPAATSQAAHRNPTEGQLWPAAAKRTQPERPRPGHSCQLHAHTSTAAAAVWLDHMAASDWAPSGLERSRPMLYGPVSLATSVCASFFWC